MHNHSTVLDRTTWGIHLNFEEYLASPPNPPSWLTQLQQQDWQRIGVVLWDADHRIVAQLYAGYALELLEKLQDNSAWKTKNLVVGSPAFQLSNNSANTLSTKMGGELVLKNKIEITPDQAQTLFKFLSAQEGSLKRISVYDKEGAKQALSKMYQLIVAYGRRVRERKGDREPIENTEPKTLPISIPRGSYFTVYQAAQICHVTSKQIKAWIRIGKFEVLNLPGLGIIIEAGTLNKFLDRRNSESNSRSPDVLCNADMRIGEVRLFCQL